ncbi:YhfC family intramembrane metalloprotease [Salinicoccus halodurans]|uniref:Uncharacterized membrane protein YhfC n=1 Tax=Salinicoccus halodurans TaxID=407035 RepID=A0A0F7HJU9_9STAP|nr:YhfC family glutamic-type intramembrane protease [Salinicoccus halodurans]AKG73019.1 hypothetical protein AAT16_01525 [Salinicoccus halodurans]SFK77537.1 Uncharacterized membrane protein YhfC [Salinicoccus halodurans]
MISTTSIVLMGLAGLFSILLPFLFIMVLRRKFKIRWIPILIGAATFIIFAMVLEQISHILVLKPGANGEIHALVDSPWLYVLYGVLAAGIFEETGRLVAFLLMKRKHRQIDSAVSYGIGHGGIEAVIVLGLGMLNTIIFSFIINSGSSIVDTLPAGTVESITGTSNITYALGIVERIFAIGVHIGLSVIVFTAVMKGRWWLFPLAIVLHALTNVTAAMMQAGLLTSIWFMYAGFIVMTLITLWIAYSIGVKQKIQKNP